MPKKQDSAAGSPRAILAIFLYLALVRGILYAVLVPPWQAPDEWAHFESSHLAARWERFRLTKNDQLPDFERELISSAYEFRFWRFIRSAPPVMSARTSETPTLGWHRTVNRPSLAYVFYAAFDKLVLHQDVIAQLYVMRAASVLVNIALVWVCWAITREIFPPLSPPVLAVMSLMVFHPQHTFMRAVVNEGGLAELAASAIYLLLIRCWQRGWRWQRILAIAIALAIAFWTKRTTYFLPLYLALIAAIYLWKNKQLKKAQWRIILPVMAILVGALLLLPQHANPIQRLGKSMTRLQACSNIGAWAWQSALQVLQMWWSDPGTQLTNRLRLELYIPLAAFSIVGLLGWARLVVRGGHRDWLKNTQVSKSLLFVLGLSLVVVTMFLTVAYIGSQNISGRYFFPAFIPTVIMIVAGWAEWVPARLHTNGLKILFALLILLDWWVITFHLLVRYHPA
jgi:hypothetical protein